MQEVPGGGALRKKINWNICLDIVAFFFFFMTAYQDVLLL